MDISAVVSTNSSTTAATENDGFSSVSGNDFMNILIKQLQYQDPFKPMGNEEMLAQMSTIRELEMNTRLIDRLDQLTGQQRFAAAAALVGMYVRGAVSDAEGNTFEVEGLVTSVRFTPEGEAILELDTGEVLPLKGLQQVARPEEII